ncbi:MAG: DUF192 domain-containing protein [Chloroflexota bacterium]
MQIAITNATRGTVVAAAASEARTFAQKLFGLMAQAQLAPSGALIIYDTNWIHTFWMRFPLDVIYVDRARRVVGVETNLRANRIGKPFWTAHAVVELNVGAVAASQTQVGDQLEFRAMRHE